MVARARTLAQQPGRVTEAADLLEEALNARPELRIDHEYHLRLWRKGMAM